MTPKDLSKNFSKMTEKVKVSVTTPDPPIVGEKQKSVSRIKDKNLEGVSTNYHTDKMELRNSNNIWLFLLGQNHERLPG